MPQLSLDGGGAQRTNFDTSQCLASSPRPGEPGRYPNWLMAISYDDASTYWNYFLALERDFEVVCRFIEPCEHNENTYSLELARLLMAATQEVDVVLKAICKAVDSSDPGNINQYFPIISGSVSDLLGDTTHLPRYGLSTVPWTGWEQSNAPIWWTANNKIKHQRHDEYQRASFKNTFNAIGGLLLVIAYYEKLSQSNTGSDAWWLVTDALAPQSRLFRLPVDRYRPTVTVGAMDW